MAEVAITYMLETLRKLTVEQFHLISSAGSELKHLEKELELMKAFLVESASRRVKGSLFRKFEKQIRDVVYEAEDILDRCLYNERSKNFVHKYLNPNSFSLAEQVKRLREDKVQQVFENAKIDFANIEQRDSIPLRREDNVVGFEDEVEILIKYFNQKTKELDVISIIGMPGLGKTTLAWKIYKDRRIQEKFETVIWVYVSQEFNKRGVFLTILKGLTDDDMSSKNDDELTSLVRFYLEKSKEFVLFMDDVWTPEVWNEIEAALPKSNNNSLGKVLLTSRQDKVALQANRKREPHKLRFLDSAESWELLQLEVFRHLNGCPSELKMHGQRIAVQCGGVPLAVVVIGGILVKSSFSPEGGHLMENEWEKVSERVRECFSEDVEKRTEKIIELSYNQLSYDLKDCFVYLAMFPEDASIEVWKLIRLWIAEGFIQETFGKSLEEVAGDNLKDLVKRNLVMVHKTKVEGDIKTCYIHDMIREFCKNKAGVEELNLFEEMKRSRGVFYPCVSKLEDHRRICIHSYVLDFLKEKPDGPRVRSFLCFSKEAITLPLELILSIPRAFNLLRVLDVNPIKLPEFPKVTKLTYLKYIALSVDQLEDLPKSVSKLWNLQTIRIHTSSRTFEIKANIWKMGQLRHLKTKAAITIDMKTTGHAAKNLQTLSRLSTQCCTVGFFEKVPNLMKLGIRGQLETLLDNSCLEKLNQLEKLKLVYDVHPKLPTEHPLHRLPQPERFPPELRIMELSSTRLDWTHMSTLGKLSALRVLKLKQNAFMGMSWNADGIESFKCLEVLLIAQTDLQLWTASNNQFPRLRCLVLKNCDKLQNIPFEHSKSLRVLDIERIGKSAVASARKIQHEKQDAGFKLIISLGDE